MPQVTLPRHAGTLSCHDLTVSTQANPSLVGITRRTFAGIHVGHNVYLAAELVEPFLALYECPSMYVVP